MNNYFYVDVDDEITSVIGRLRKEKSEEIFLVVPKRAIISQSLVNLKLLGKESNKLRKKLIFVSPDSNTRKIAEKAGLSVKKYVAQPKENSHAETQKVAAMQKKKRLEPWEEAAAKEELKKAIDKDKPAPKTPAAFRTPTKIKAGVFSAHRQIVPAPPPAKASKESSITSAKPQVVDLKKQALEFRRELVPGSHRRLTTQRETRSPELIKEKREEKLAEDKDLVNKKVEFVEEPPLKELLKPPTDGMMQNVQPKIKPRLVKTSPFKVKKLGVKDTARDSKPEMAPRPPVLPGSRPNGQEGILPPSASHEPSEAIVSDLGAASPESRTMPPVGELPIKPQNVLPREFERETANLTLKEKERLRDLWMEQKGVVRGKSLQESTNLDLKAATVDEPSKEEFITKDSGLFQTTHRRVVGPGKVIDLRVAKSPLSGLTNLEERKIQQKKGREIILPLLNIKLFVAFVLGISAILLIIIGIIVPESTVLIKPKRTSDNLEFKAWASGEVSQPDPGQRTIPGKSVHFKVSEEKLYPATTDKEIKGKSEGQVAIYNTANKPLSLKQNAMLVDSSGNKFYLSAPVTVPASKQDTATDTAASTGATAGSAFSRVTAEGSSKEFNQKEGSSLSIPGLDGGEYAGLVTVEVTEEIKGGEIRMVKIISQEDIDKAKEELVENAKQKSLEEIKNNLEAEAAGQVQSEDLVIEDVSFTSDKSVGQEADSFKATVSVTFFAVAFSQEDLQTLAKTVIESDREEKEGTVKVNNYRLNDAKPLENKIEISANLDYQIINEVDGSEIKKAIVAKKRQEAEDYLRGRNDIESYTLSVWPNILGHMPILDRRIKVEVQ